MTATTTAPASADHDQGIIGDRELVCLQTIDIGRLRSAPVPITPGTFIAVSGRGPKGDSNGSGKTTFLAAISLLHGEVGWRLANGAPEATSLLFDGTKAGVDVQRYARAEHGYIIGLFRSRGDEDDSITIWLRINAAAPVLRARMDFGIHLVQAATSTARAAAADAAWAALPKPEWGSRAYAQELFGPTPRCMAWLQARGNETPGRSLLKLSQEMLTPEQIGVALLELLGRDDLLDQDRTARAELDATVREVDDLRSDDSTRRRDEDDELKAINGRNQARGHLTRAERLWQLHFAKGLVDASTRLVQARQDIHPLAIARREARRQLRTTAGALDNLGDGTALKAAAAAAQSALEQANEAWRQASNAKSIGQNQLDIALANLEGLTITAEAWDGTSVEELSATHAEQEQRLSGAKAAEAVAIADRERSESNLRAAEEGTAGAAAGTTARLRQAGVAATPLIDAIEIETSARSVWEPRLALYRDAVAVDASDIPAALSASQPGDTLVTGEPQSGPAPAGISAAPSTSIPFLHHLAGSDSRANAAQLTEHVLVVGGFTTAITGRRARINAARAATEEAQDKERHTTEETAFQQRGLEDLERRLKAAHSAHDLGAARETVSSLREGLASLDAEENTAAETYRQTNDEFGTAREAWGGYNERRRRLEEAKERDQQELWAASQKLRNAVETYYRYRSNLPYWAQRWGGDHESAITALASEAAADPGGDDRTSSSSYRRASNHAIDRALILCGIDADTGVGAPAGSGVDLAVAERARAGTPGPDDERGQSYERQATAFHAVADALGAWLERLRVEDHARDEHIAADRERRATALSAAEALCDERRRNLPVIQDQIERLLRTALATVGEKLNQLDLAAQGSGADLLIEPQRPSTARESWQWKVTPRYRRGPNGGLVPYTERANTATEKLLAINLVLAALFAATAASSNRNGRVLILDELGDSLGDYHREAVLQALARTAEEAGITVLGTCQDGVLDDAARHCGLLLYFQFRDPSDILNAPTRVFGSTHDGKVVEEIGHLVERLP
jgi:chromosome segregation protein